MWIFLFNILFNYKTFYIELIKEFLLPRKIKISTRKINKKCYVINLSTHKKNVIIYSLKSAMKNLIN